MSYFDVVIAGGGASGVMAAISAKLHNPDKEVLLLERQTNLLNKVRASGNGRCNLSNQHLNADCYFSIGSSDKQKNKFVQTALNKVDYPKTKKIFESLGLFLRVDPYGRVYPYAEQAELVIDCLIDYLQKLNVEVWLQHELTDLEELFAGANSYSLHPQVNFNLSISSLSVSDKLRKENITKTIQCNQLILACGSSAAKNLGGVENGYKLLKQLNVAISELRPALVPLILAKDKTFQVLSGQRFKGRATLFANRKNVFQVKGEFLFTKTGLSGIAAMELARFIKPKNKYLLQIDFVPDLTKEQLKEFAANCSKSVKEKQFYHIAKGFVRKNIAKYISSRTKTFQELIKNLKELPLEITGTLPQEKAQIIAGGAVLDQISLLSFALKKNPNIYVCGELLDVDGRTGGYNLQWAWTSGYIAGQLRSMF